MKDVRIHDTVHGYIELPWEYVTYILDTPEFQRLRRIEQTAIRSVYPTARHDRFVHSLGVFHVGNMILRHFLAEKNISSKEDHGVYKNLKKNKTLQASYRIACLLHDVGHAPFSHSFESYYGGKNKEELAKILSDSINDYADNNAKIKFIEDYSLLKDEGKEPAYHEYTSAIVSLKRYGKDIKEKLHGDAELVARMITGCKYCDKGGNVLPEEYQLNNIFIELLHSDIVDADRLDYACRDIWASGYSTSSVDVYRLVDSMHIRKNKAGNIVLCYDSKSINEIESVLAVREFQCSYVINHHTIVYDQYLLQKAAEKMASELFSKDMNVMEDYDGQSLTDEQKASKSLSKIINIDSLLPQNGDSKTETLYSYDYIADEDLLFLMKQSKGNSYYKEWASRQYNYFPLWKSIDEFHELFPITRQHLFKNNIPFFPLLPEIDKFETIIKQSIIDNKTTDIIVVKIDIKAKVKLSELQLLVNGNIISFKDLYPLRSYRENVSPDYKKKQFYYVYCKGANSKENHKNREKLRKKYISRLQNPKSEFLLCMNNLYQTKEQKIIDYITENPKTTLNELANQFDLKKSGIDKYIRKLKKQGLLFRVGSNKGGHWEVMMPEKRDV